MKILVVIAAMATIISAGALVTWRLAHHRAERARADLQLEACRAERDELMRALDEQRARVEALENELAAAQDRARAALEARDAAVRRVAAVRRARPPVEPDACTTTAVPEQTRQWLLKLVAGGSHD